MSITCTLERQVLHKDPLLYRFYYSQTVGLNNEPDLPFHGSTENILGNISHCGNSAIDINKAIIKGEDAPQKAWPWQVFLSTTNSDNNSYACGGSLISDSWVVTAAHCLVGDNVRLYFGTINLTTARDDAKRNDSGVQLRKPAKIILHERFVISHHVSDIALVKLDAPVEFTDYVRPICLPKPGQEFYDERSGDCYATGWGQTGYFQNSSDVLQQIKVTVMPQSLCIYGWVLLNVQFDRRILCLDLNDAESGVCFGDSGGPLACKVNGRFVLAGVAHAVPNAFNCTFNFFPSAYLTVTEHLEWIADHVKENE